MSVLKNCPRCETSEFIIFRQVDKVVGNCVFTTHCSQCEYHLAAVVVFCPFDQHEVNEACTKVWNNLVEKITAAREVKVERKEWIGNAIIAASLVLYCVYLLWVKS